MNLKWTLIVIAALALGGILFWSNVGRAPESSEKRDVTIAAPDGVSGDVLTAGDTVNVRAAIDGDLIVAGDRIVVAAPVEGYVAAAGAELAISGAIENDLWAAGRSVAVSSQVEDSARVAGRSVMIQEQSRIGRDAWLAGNRVEVRGPVTGDLRIGAAEAVLAAEIGGSVHARTGSLKVLPDTVIRGDLITYGAKPDVAPGAQVLGRVQHHAPEVDERGSVTSWLAQWLLAFLALLVLGVTTTAAAPRGSVHVADEIRRRAGWSLLVGVIALLVIPLWAALLTATIVGIPLALVAFALYGAALLSSGVFVSLRIGGWIMQRADRPGASCYARLAAGALLLSLLAVLPWIGWLVWLLTLAVGLGALLLERRDACRREPAATPI